MQSQHTIAGGVAAVSWFDAVVLVWLIIGFLRGRKNGMSLEILMVLQWMAIVVASAQFYQPIGIPLAQSTGLSPEWAFRISYSVVALVIGGIMARIKTMVGEKIVGADLFGNGEYFLGMATGVVRFACMVVVFLALLGARVPTSAEVASVNKKGQENFGDVSVNPLKIQRDILLASQTGRYVREYLKSALIIPTAINTNASKETIAHRRERAVDDIMSPAPISVAPSK